MKSFVLDSGLLSGPPCKLTKYATFSTLLIAFSSTTLEIFCSYCCYYIVVSILEILHELYRN